MVEGYVWQGACVVGVGVCMAMGACMVGGVWWGHALQGNMCGGGGGMRAARRPLKGVVRILLECIPVLYCFGAKPDIDERTG